MKKLTFEIRSPAHQQNAIHAVQQILPDPTKPIVVTIQERNRSLDQNRKLWACLGDVSRQVEWHGRWLDAESWKCVFTAALKQQDVVPNLAGNGFVVIGQSTSRMRVGEFAELLELIQAFGTERGVWQSGGKKHPLPPDCQTSASWLIWFTSIAGSEACIRMRSLIRGNQTRTTGWLPTCIRTCGPMRLLMRNYAVRPQMSLSI